MFPRKPKPEDTQPIRQLIFVSDSPLRVTNLHQQSPTLPPKIHQDSPQCTYLNSNSLQITSKEQGTQVGTSLIAQEKLAKLERYEPERNETEKVSCAECSSYNLNRFTGGKDVKRRHCRIKNENMDQVFDEFCSDPSAGDYLAKRELQMQRAKAQQSKTPEPIFILDTPTGSSQDSIKIKKSRKISESHHHRLELGPQSTVIIHPEPVCDLPRVVAGRCGRCKCCGQTVKPRLVQQIICKNCKNIRKEKKRKKNVKICRKFKTGTSGSGCNPAGHTYTDAKINHHTNRWDIRESSVT